MEVPLRDEERGRRVDQRLRWVGAGSMGCMVPPMLLGAFGGEGADVMRNMIGVLMWCGLCVAFLRGGRRWQLGIGIFFAMFPVILVGGSMWEIQQMQERRRLGVPMDADFWPGLVGVLLAALLISVPAVCGLALFVRGRRREARERGLR